MSQILSNRFLGAVFVAVLVFSVWLVYAVFAQKFTSFAEVRLNTDTVGLQLPKRADVKVRGVIVGQVNAATTGPTGATLTLGLKPDKVGQIPANVTASILPKTLFGEKYVELVIPPEPAKSALKAGDTITQTELPIEVERVLNDIYPLLRAVQPAELNYTLNAVASALEGRGDLLGQSIETLDSYLKRINPEIKNLISDLRLLASVSGTYADAMPALAQTMRDSVTTGKTLRNKEAQLNAFLVEVAATSKVTDRVLTTNGDNIVRVGELTEPVAKLLKRYSPQFPCMFEGLAKQIPQLANAFRGYTLHIDLILLPRQPRGYGPQDLPVFGAKNPPNCAGLPNPKIPFTNVPNFDDGVDGLGRGDNQRVAPEWVDTGVVAGAAGSEADRALYSSLAAPVLGVPADEVPDLSTLLLGPLVVGTQVNIR